MEQLAHIELGDITVSVIQKDIKNIHLSVYPPTGTVRISAPERMSLDTIRIYAISKLGWIRKQQKKLRQQERESTRMYVTRESHYFMGKRYLLKVIEHDAAPKVIRRHKTIELYVRPESDREQKRLVMQEWYRQQLKNRIPSLIEKWKGVMKVQVADFGVKRMKTKWGTCNREAGRIWFNLELAKKPVECLEYIVVHEMVHLLERNHSARFIALMDAFLPQWRAYKAVLNRLPISHADWKY